MVLMGADSSPRFSFFLNIGFMESNDMCFRDRVMDYPGAVIIPRFDETKVKE